MYSPYSDVHVAVLHILHTVMYMLLCYVVLHYSDVHVAVLCILHTVMYICCVM